MTYKPPRKGYDPPTEYRPPAHGQPSTLPKDSRGLTINEDGRRRKAEEAAFKEQHGRRMSKKDRKRLRRDRERSATRLADQPGRGEIHGLVQSVLGSAPWH